MLFRYLELADVYHCEPIENTATDLIEKRGIVTGSFDNTTGDFNVHMVFDIAKVYKRLIVNVAESEGLRGWQSAAKKTRQRRRPI